MKYTYRGKEFEIEVCDSDGWGDLYGYFHVIDDQPYCFGYAKTFEEMKEIIRKKYDKYHENIPNTKKGWIELFQSCVIQDGYEEWHVDEDLAMRLLELYKKEAK